MPVKCLLMSSTAESALNDGSGELLLKQHEYYSQKTKRITEIQVLSSKLPEVRPDLGTYIHGQEKCDRPEGNSQQKLHKDVA